MAEPLTASGRAEGRLRPAQEPPTSFAVIGDYGGGGTGQRQVADMIETWAVDFVVTTGDNNYGSLHPDPAAFPEGRTHWSLLVGDFYGRYMKGREDGLYPEQTSAVQRFFPCVGNHDSGPWNTPWGDGGGTGGLIGGYVTYFHSNGEGPGRLPADRGAVHNVEVSYYATRQGPFDLLVLDADAVNVEGAIAQQRQWLRERLAESQAPWKIAVFHQPPITSSFRTGAAWMDWDELLEVDAILCGHDHFYERLDFRDGGPPLFINGIGGRSIYSFGNAHPRSRVRYNSHYGAMRVRADESGAEFEFRAYNAQEGREELIESFPLGEPLLNDPHDDYSFFAEGGVTVRAGTQTPGQNNRLNPALELHGPDHRLLAQAAAGNPDGRNARLAATLGTGGWHRLRVLAEDPAPGAYQLEVSLEHPLGNYPEWRARHFSAAGEGGEPMADPDRDGLANLLEYALGLAPRRSSAEGPGLPEAELTADGRFVQVSLDLPAPAPLDVAYVLELSSSMEAGSWTEIARRERFSSWQSPAGFSVDDSGPGTSRLTLSLPVALEDARKFVRLRVVHQS